MAARRRERDATMTRSTGRSRRRKASDAGGRHWRRTLARARCKPRPRWQRHKNSLPRRARCSIRRARCSRPTAGGWPRSARRWRCASVRWPTRRSARCGRRRHCRVAAEQDIRSGRPSPHLEPHLPVGVVLCCCACCVRFLWAFGGLWAVREGGVGSVRYSRTCVYSSKG
jgi:hypothetical protein